MRSARPSERLKLKHCQGDVIPRTRRPGCCVTQDQPLHGIGSGDREATSSRRYRNDPTLYHQIAYTKESVEADSFMIRWGAQRRHVPGQGIVTKGQLPVLSSMNSTLHWDFSRVRERKLADSEVLQSLTVCASNEDFLLTPKQSYYPDHVPCPALHSAATFLQA